MARNHEMSKISSHMYDKNVFDELKEYFQAHSVAYREITHAAGASAEDYHNAVGCRYEQQAKCLLIKVYGDNERFIVFTLPGNKRADLEKIQDIFKAKRVRMATRDELKTVTGCNFGELPPVGKMFNLQLAMDNDFLREKEIYLGAGKIDVSFVVNPGDIQRMEEAIMV